MRNGLFGGFGHFPMALVTAALALEMSFASGLAHASLVEFSRTDLGGGTWRLDYSIQGTAPVDGFEGITVYFDSAAYSNLSNLSVGTQCDPIVVQPDSSVPVDGFVDLLNMSGILTGAFSPFTFSLKVDYLLAGAPDSQNYELYLSSPFQITASGQSELQASGGTLPEPTSLVLVVLALASLGWARLRPAVVRTRACWKTVPIRHLCIRKHANTRIRA